MPMPLWAVKSWMCFGRRSTDSSRARFQQHFFPGALNGSPYPESVETWGDLRKPLPRHGVPGETRLGEKGAGTAVAAAHQESGGNSRRRERTHGITRDPDSRSTAHGF